MRVLRIAMSNTATAAKPAASAYECPRARPAAKAISGSAAGTSLRTLERSERFHVMRVGEEVQEVERSESPTRRDQPARVAGERYRITRQEANHLVRARGDGVDDVAPRPAPRRIEKNKIRARHPLHP